MPCLLSRAGAENSERRRALPDYERDGRRFYGLARAKLNRHGPHPSTSALQKIHLAREALSTLNDYYLKPLRTKYFEPPRREEPVQSATNFTRDRRVGSLACRIG